MLVQRLTGDPDARILAATTFRDLLEVIYAKFCGLATELLLRVFEAGHGFPFLNLHHDGWTTGNGKVSVMGASASFIDASWQPREIALLLTVGHSSHMSSDVQKMICTRIEEVFGVDINTMAQFTVSDTASREQGDSRDLRPGDEHPQATQQRCKRLEDVQKFFCLPSMGTTLDCDMRVAYTVKLFQQTIVNYSAFAFYSQKPEKGDDASVFEFLSAAEWRLVTEMEAIVCSIADLARIEVQRSGLVASELIVLLKFTANRLIGDMFSLFALHQTTDKMKTKDDLTRLLLVRRGDVICYRVDALCEYVDILRWFRESGSVQFLSIAALSRVWLGRAPFSAFQERVFSTGGIVMSSLRTRTDNHRAEMQVVLKHNRKEIQRMEADSNGTFKF
ncbi:hypothetical protein PF002_g4671 [Phytophthora fragariae]|uniref:HAT C-terminal dimerisation domain-containing protein n=1 Tax=Phytophthora fragariae TaxID=53985 RepID=A0A6A4A6Z3_9STRA|nr:hypothetical protein PF002_g4671 [Phytophthora fragariae]